MKEEKSIIKKESEEIAPEEKKDKHDNGEVFENKIAALISKAGSVELTEEQKKILYAPVKEETVEIRPDGLVYLPWCEYVTRLRDAFGLKWAIIPKGMPQVFGKHVVWGFWLMLDGKPAGFALGEQEYHPNNPTMSWTDACEGAKSNALMRLCKGLGISLELWKPSFIIRWKEKYAESTWITDRYGKRRLVWQKKAEHLNHQEESSKSDNDFSEATYEENHEEAKKEQFRNIQIGKKKYTKFEALKYFQKAKQELGEEAYYDVLGSFGYEHANQLPVSVIPEVFEILKQKRNSLETEQKPESVDDEFKLREPGEEG